MSETSRLSAAAVLAQFPGPVTLRPNNRDYVRHLIIMLLATAVGAWGLWHYAQVENLPYMLMNVPILVVGATCSVVIAQALMNGFMRLTLDSEGFESHDTWRLRRRRWRDASDFKPTTLLNNPVVAYQYAYLPTGFWRRFFFGGRQRQAVRHIWPHARRSGVPHERMAPARAAYCAAPRRSSVSEKPVLLTWIRLQSERCVRSAISF